MIRRRIATPPGVPIPRARPAGDLRELGEVFETMRVAGFVMTARAPALSVPIWPSAGSEPPWWVVELWFDTPGLPMPAELRYLGIGTGASPAAALAELRACLAEQRVLRSALGWCGTHEYTARLRRECTKAAEELGAAGVALPVDDQGGA